MPSSAETEHVPRIGLRKEVQRAVAALEAFGLRGRSPLHIRRALSLWPHSSELSVDDADRVVLLLITRCTACGWSIELVPGKSDSGWRHVDEPSGPSHRPVPEEESMTSGWNSGSCGVSDVVLGANFAAPRRSSD
jgi:hypothetical protein